MVVNGLQTDDKKLEATAREFGLRLVVLSGSYAKAHPRSDSDADVAVLVFGGRMAECADRADLEMDLSERLGEAVQAGEGVDMVLLNGANSLLLYEVAKYGRPLYEAEPFEFLRFQSYASRRYDDDQRFFRMRAKYLEERFACATGAPTT